MADILIRGVDETTLRRLKSRAKRHGRSLQGEAKLLLEEAAGISGDEVSTMLSTWRKRFAGRKLTKSVDLIRKDRSR